MIWLLWRQHRSQAVVAGITLGLFAVAVWITGVHMAHIYNDATRNCPANGACDAVGRLFQGYGAIVDTVHLTDTVPVLLGVFVGAILVARETEHATNILVWTQSVTRRRWLRDKVALAVGAALVVSGAVAALVTWWSKTPNALYGNRFEGAQFDTQNILPIAFALFAVALGIAAGCLFRRTLPALAATVGGFAALRVAVAVYLRPHYMKAVVQSFPLSGSTQLPPGTWTLSANLADATGHVVSGRLGIPPTCAAALTRSDVQSCLGRLGFHTVVTYQPASRYWHFQSMEAGLFTALAAALLLFSILYTLRHDA